MSWAVSRRVWQLEGPLHVGMPPSGSLNRCRLYVPARTLWGALTAEVARRQATGFPPYEQVGEAIRRDVRLTYLYPAERTGTDWRAWLPRYEVGQGLVWQREDRQQDDDDLSDRAMRSRLLVTRPGTAIDPVSDAAAEGTLREVECIGQYWRTSTGDVKPVGLVGYLLVRESSLMQGALAEIDELFLGGDTRYGLGRVRLVGLEPATQVFGVTPNLDRADPQLIAERVLAHAAVGDGPVTLRGDLEALAWWDARELQRATGMQVRWRPGSVASGPVRWTIEGLGLWILDVTGERSEIGARAVG